MNMKHALVIALVVWILLSFMPALLLTNVMGMGRRGAAK